MQKNAFVGFEVEPLDSKSLVTRVGGVPRGFDFERWPLCETCQQRQVFVLQLDLRNPVALAKKHRWAFVFACEDIDCEPFLDDSGANAVILVTHESALAVSTTPIAENLDCAVLPEHHCDFQPWTEEDDDWPGAPALRLGMAPNYQWDIVSDCPHCGGEMSLAAELEYVGSNSACFITICNAECEDDAASFMW